MAYPFQLFLKDTLSITEQDGDVIIADPAGAAIRISTPDPGIRILLDALKNKKLTESDLYDLMAQSRGTDLAARFWYYLGKFDRKGMICRRLAQGCRATLIPMAKEFVFRKTAPDIHKEFTLSRFAYCRNYDGNFTIESPLGHGKIETGHRGAGVLARLSQPVSIAQLCRLGEGDDLSEEEIQAFFILLMNIRALDDPAQPSAPAKKAKKTVLAQWDFHDLLFHTRSRMGRHAKPVGGTFRFKDGIDPLPALKPVPDENHISLFKPDLDTLKKNDIPFTKILEDRRSIRDYSQTSLTIDQVGEFLFRAARAVTVQDPDPDRGIFYQSTTRPSPSGGAMHPFEIYPLINECTGIEPGLFHYNPKAHTLSRVSKVTDETEQLLDHACMATNLQYEPGILMVVAARFQRTGWKYESIAYSLILKDLGALYQTFYLVATAMDLAPCAIGTGDSDLFTRAARLNYYTETSVGEFLLSSRQGAGSP